MILLQFGRLSAATPSFNKDNLHKIYHKGALRDDITIQFKLNNYYL